MSGLRKRSLAVVASAALLTLIAAVAVTAFGPPRLSGGDGIPTQTVQRQEFVRQVEADGTLRAVTATPLGLPQGLRSVFRIAWLAPDGSRVEAGDPVVRFDPTEMEEQMVTAREDLSTNELRLDKTEAENQGQLAGLAKDADMAALELESARQFQKKDETIFSRNEILESEIDQELAAKKQRHSEHSQQSRRELSEIQLDLLRIEGRQARQKIQEARQGLDSLVIRAPHEGLVVFQRDWRGNMPRVGDTAYPGNTLAELPDLSAMKAEVFVLEADAGGLEEGQSARVVLDARPERGYDARVARVDALAKPRRRGSPVQYFAVDLELETTDAQRMKPGQRVRAAIEIERVEDALVISRQAVFEERGETVVFRKSGDGFEAVPVTLGATGVGRLVVTDGLEEGDRIALADPRTGAEEADAEGQQDDRGVRDVEGLLQ